MRKMANSNCMDNGRNTGLARNDGDKDSCRGECMGDDNTVPLGSNNFSSHLCSHWDDCVVMHDRSFQFSETATLPQATMALKEHSANVKVVEAPAKSINNCSVSSRPHNNIAPVNNVFPNCSTMDQPYKVGQGSGAVLMGNWLEKDPKKRPTLETSSVRHVSNQVRDPLIWRGDTRGRSTP